MCNTWMSVVSLTSASRPADRYSALNQSAAQKAEHVDLLSGDKALPSSGSSSATSRQTDHRERLAMTPVIADTNTQYQLIRQRLNIRPVAVYSV